MHPPQLALIFQRNAGYSMAIDRFEIENDISHKSMHVRMSRNFGVYRFVE